MRVHASIPDVLFTHKNSDFNTVSVAQQSQPHQSRKWSFTYWISYVLHFDALQDFWFRQSALGLMIQLPNLTVSQRICQFNYGRNCVISRNCLHNRQILYQSNFGRKPESNSNLIPAKHRFTKVGEKTLKVYSLLLAVLFNLDSKTESFHHCKKSNKTEQWRPLTG